MKVRQSIALLLVTVFALAACAPQAATQAPSPSSATGSGPTVVLGKSDQLGSFLVDPKGMTLYLFLKDSPNTSNCYDACAKSWPPLLADGSPVAGDGLDAAKLGITARTDGTSQVTYNGWPLYYFANDKQPGDTNGQNVKQVWFVISPAGEKVDGASGAAPTAMVMPTGTAAAAGGDVAVTEGSNVSVSIAGFAFDPATIKVHQGTTVTWTNNDAPSHTVTSDTGAFDSGTLQPGSAFSFTFTQTGTFAYHCSIHRSMKATIVVVP
jgi:predicted lipoprotein with Yx(FWY)xxD motif/plastocyanin